MGAMGTLSRTYMISRWLYIVKVRRSRVAEREILDTANLCGSFPNREHPKTARGAGSPPTLFHKGTLLDRGSRGGHRAKATRGHVPPD